MAPILATKVEQQAGESLGAVPWATFRPALPPLRTRLARLHVLARSVRPAPAHRVLRPATAAGPWALYFVYSPDGGAFAQHRFTLERLRGSGFSVLVVVASRADDAVVRHAFEAADALIVKALPGFDFSGYAIGLTHLVSRLGRVDAVVMNDSVFGPFGDLLRVLDRSPWFMTGFTASAAIEPHLQSYAFLLKGLDAARLAVLRRVLWRRVACNRHGPVAFLQESRLARVATAAGPVGSVWTPCDPRYDLTMAHPLALLDADFPFLKRSLLGKFAADFDTPRVRDALARHGHPHAGADLFLGAV